MNPLIPNYGGRRMHNATMLQHERSVSFINLSSINLSPIYVSSIKIFSKNLSSITLPLINVLISLIPIFRNNQYVHVPGPNAKSLVACRWTGSSAGNRRQIRLSPDNTSPCKVSRTKACRCDQSVRSLL